MAEQAQKKPGFKLKALFITFRNQSLKLRVLSSWGVKLALPYRGGSLDVARRRRLLARRRRLLAVGVQVDSPI